MNITRTMAVKNAGMCQCMISEYNHMIMFCVQYKIIYIFTKYTHKRHTNNSEMVLNPLLISVLDF